MKQTLQKILENVESYRQTGQNTYMAKCPCHKDDKPSLSITLENDKILIHDFAGCDTNLILKKLGLSTKDLFLKDTKETKTKIVEAEYIYLDENEKKLYKAIRYKGKKFRQAKYYNGEWIYTMQDVKYVLYNLPNIIKSDIIYFVEGEKDADNLNKLGLTATTTIGRCILFQKKGIRLL